MRPPCLRISWRGWRTPSETRAPPVRSPPTAGSRCFALVRRSTEPLLRDFLRSGGRAVHRWFETLGAVEVPFDDAAAFRNINAPADAGAEGAERSA